MFKWLKTIPSLLIETAKEFGSNKPLVLAAAISFYIILSLGPILVLLMLTLGAVFGEYAVQGQIVSEIENAVGQKPAEIIQQLIHRAYQFPSKTITILSSIPLLFFGWTMIFYQIRNALNLIWQVKQEESGGIVKRLKEYSFSFIMLFVISFLLFLLILKSPALQLIEDNIINLPRSLIQIIDMLFSFVSNTILFAMMFKILPAKKIPWSDVWIGAAVTSFLFIVVQALVGVNFRNTNIGSALGALGSTTILVLWIFYSSLIFLFGASFTKVYAKKYGCLSDSTNK